MALEWSRALVTGASAGIGRAIAKKLADEGTELVLVARDGERLEQLAATLPVRVEVLRADLTDPADLAVVAERVGAEEAPVDLLVNNAGFGTHGRFHELELAPELRQIDLNVVALVRLCHAAAGRMAAAGSGTILNISSIAGASPGASLATYAATKAFVTSFTDSLHEELQPHGVRVCAVLPGLTRTEFHERSGYHPSGLPDLVWQSAEAVAAEALAAAARNQAVAVTGWPNRVAMAATRFLPRGVARRAARAVRE
jgi:short-subunit dehydrogenase